MKEFSVSTSASGTTDWIRMDSTPSHANKQHYTLLVEISGTLQADVEFSVEKDLASATAIQHDILKELTASKGSLEETPATAFRLNVTSYTSGTATLKILQGG